jgi:hypothetical protein
MGFLRRIAAILHPAAEEYNDPTFGPFRRVGGGDWYGEVPFQHPPTGARSISLLIGAGGGHPADEQRAFVGEILARYAELWP